MRRNPKTYGLNLTLVTIDDEIKQIRDTWARRTEDIRKAKAAIELDSNPMQLAADRAWLDELQERRKSSIVRVVKSIDVESRLIQDYSSQAKVQRRMKREESADRFEHQIALAQGRRLKWVDLLRDIAPDRVGVES